MAAASTRRPGTPGGAETVVRRRRRHVPQQDCFHFSDVDSSSNVVEQLRTLTSPLTNSSWIRLASAGVHCCSVLLHGHADGMQGRVESAVVVAEEATLIADRSSRPSQPNPGHTPQTVSHQSCLHLLHRRGR